MSYDRVQEDWQVVIGVPDSSSETPQLGTLMTPDNTNPDLYAIFKLNYRDEPSFSAGGLEVEAWNSTTLEAYSVQKTALLQTDDEKISWTERLNLSGGNAYFQVLYGESVSWGNFGDSTNLAISFATSTTSFSNYTPDASVSGSDVSYGDNTNVTGFTLAQVRYYQGDTLVLTDTNARLVDLSS